MHKIYMENKYFMKKLLFFAIFSLKLIFIIGHILENVYLWYDDCPNYGYKCAK